MSFDLEKFRQGKLYDFLMGVPLIIWFGYVGVIRVRPNLAIDARFLLAHPTSLLANLQFLSYLASVIFNIVTVYLIVVRTAPVRRTSGLWGRVFGFVGTFLAVGIQRLPMVHLSLNWQIVASALIFTGGLGSIITISSLGKSFSIMPEARTLVTSGPYAYARHPLYVMEIITVVGSAMLFRQLWAALMAIAVALLLGIRSHFEEQVLMEAYPGYAQYKLRVKRFGIV